MQGHLNYERRGSKAPNIAAASRPLNGWAILRVMMEWLLQSLEDMQAGNRVAFSCLEKIEHAAFQCKRFEIAH